MELWVCDQGDWRKAGEGVRLGREKQKIIALGMGDKLKLVFKKPSPNILAERTVGFSLLQIRGSPLSYFRGVVNHELPLHQQH